MEGIDAHTWEVALPGTILLLVIIYIIQVIYRKYAISNNSTVDIKNQNNLNVGNSFDVNPAKSPRQPSYRMDEENFKYKSSEYSSRGKIWSSRPNWHLWSAPRANDDPRLLRNLDHVLSILRKYDVDPFRGFLPSQDPLQRLPYTRYHLWEDLADDLPKLLSARLGQARDPLKQLPVLNIDKLSTDRELRRAHLLLCLFAHAFVWGGNEPLDYIPEGSLEFYIYG